MNSFELKLRNIMYDKGITRPYRQLLNLGIPRNTAQKMLKGTATSINLAHLHKLCLFLNCTPKELLVVPTPPHPELYQNTPLQDWISKPDLLLAQEIQQLTPQEMQAMKTYLKTLKSENKPDIT